MDAEGREIASIVPGRGTLYEWNILSPRLGVTMKLTGDGRTMARASYGRFSQGVLTGELQFFPPWREHGHDNAVRSRGRWIYRDGSSG